MIDRPTPTRGATAPLFFAFAPENNFELDSIFFVAAFQNLAWFPGLVPDSKSGKC